MDFKNTISITHQTEYIFSNNLFEYLESLSKNFSKWVVFIDYEVYLKYKNEIGDNKNFKVIQSGEAQKDYYKIVDYYKFLIDHEIDKNALIIGIGGGVVSDIVGFVATTFKRGVPFGLIPTTILSAVDAAIGGKNGVNFLGYKNIIGSISQPNFIIFNREIFSALPQEIFIEGFAEVIKYGCIYDIEFFEFLEKNKYSVFNVDSQDFLFVLKKCVEIKNEIVASDPTEKNMRKILNFGHTLGHAIEASESIPHGNAVSIGMHFAAFVSLQKGFINLEMYDRIENLLENYGLPTSIPFNVDSILKKMSQDKKRNGDFIDFILLEQIGRAKILPLSMDEIKNYLNLWKEEIN